MKTSDNIGEIAGALAAAQAQMGAALKDSTNPHFKSRYADLGTCLDAVNEALLNHGIAVYQETSEDASGVTVETVFLHESGESLRGGKLHVPASKQDPQGYGSALTYCRRYSLMAACGIAAEDDDGNAASKAPHKPRQAAEKPFDLMAALDWVGKGANVEQVKQRGRQAYAKATNDEERARIAALVEELEQAALAAA